MLAIVARSAAARSRARAVKFDKFADHFLRAQHLRDVQREIGRGDAFAQAHR